MKTLQPDHPYLHRGTIPNYGVLLNAFLPLITIFVSLYIPLLVAMIYLELLPRTYIVPSLDNVAMESRTWNKGVPMPVENSSISSCDGL